MAPLEELAAELIAAGVPASTNTERVNPPAAWVHASDLTFDRLNGNGTIAVEIDLIVPDQTSTAALTQLQELLGRTLEVVEPDGPIELDRAVQLRGGAQLPAFRVPVNIDLT